MVVASPQWSRLTYIVLLLMSHFHNTLNRFRRRWCFGRIVCVFFVLTSLVGFGLLVHGWLDFKWALSSAARWRLNAVLFTVLSVLALVALYRVIRTSRAAAAALVDDMLSDPRQRVAGAASLEKLEVETPMQKFHLERALDDAARELEKLPVGRRMPFKAMAYAVGGLILLFVVVFSLKSLAPEPFRIAAIRVLDPASDIPPYSPLVFKVTPGELSAVYGGEAVAEVEITGGEITEDVVCLIRNIETGRLDEITVYQESPGHYATKFSNTLSSVEFAFSCGRARSAWNRLDVLLQPKFSAVTVKVQPPAYTGRSEEVYPLDSGEIKVLEGSSVTLQVESNRPLSGGELQIKPLSRMKGGRAKVVQADSVDRGDGRQLQFSWQAHASSQVSAMIRDIRSTAAENPLELKVKVIPDQVPVVDMESPQLMVLATPETQLPFQAKVEDDHGLSKVSMVRALVGYRDRGRVLADSLVKKNFDFNEPLKLSELGVEVGQVLEFYLEAMDRNPSLLGQGVSEVVRVKIISIAEYAERIRSKVQLREFTSRYRALADALRQASQALDKLDSAADIGDEKAFKNVQKEAESAHEKAKKLAEKLAEDFKAFAMEKRLSQAAEEAAQKFGQNKQAIGKLDLSSGEAATRRAIAEMKKNLGGVQKKTEQVQLDAEIVKKVSDVIEMAAQFKKIHNTQKSLVERINVIAKEVAMGNTRNTTQLENLGRQQELNRQALIKLAKDLKIRANRLPEGFEQMQNDVDFFLKKLEQLDIQDPMRAATEATEEGRSVDASANAMLALSLMDQLINEPDNGF